MKENKKNNKIKVPLLNQKGMALLTTLIFVFILVTLAVALLAMTINDSKLSSLQRESTRAFYLSETGIEKAMWYLNSSEDNPDGLDFMGPLDGGTTAESYNVDVSDIDDTGPDEIKTLISTGKVVGGGEYNKGTRKIEVKLMKGISSFPGLSYEFAIFTDDDMDINGGISIDGNIHSNGNIDISNPNIFILHGDSKATACGYNNYPGGGTGVTSQTLPIVDFEYFRELVIDPTNPDAIYELTGNGKYYGSNNSVEFDDSNLLTLRGIHFIDGDIIVKSDLKLINATIFATGDIRVLGSGDIEFKNVIEVNPLSLIAIGDITIGGKVHGAGIIQTNEGDFTNNGAVDIDEGAIYAIEGTFNGGGNKLFNVRYSTALATLPIDGVGVPIWKKISWREIY